MLRGKGEVRYFDWKTGTGTLHDVELKCPKDCAKPEHTIPFTWRQVIDKKTVETGAILAYTAYPKGEEQPRIKTLNPTWGI